MMTDERIDLALRLKEAREYLGLSQQEVAIALSIPRSAISLLESGQRKVDTVELKALAKLYQRPMTFFTGEVVDTDDTMPADVAMLAKQVAKLSDDDRNELLRFSQFLSQRAQIKTNNNE